MVDVEVGDQDPAPRGALLHVARGDGDLVEEAEAHCAIRARVVAGRPHRAEGVTRAPAGDLVHRDQERADGRAGHFEAPRAHVGIPVDGAPAPGGQVADARHVRRRVNQREIRVGRGPGTDAPETRHGLEGSENRLESLGPLRMPLGAVLEKERVRDDQAGCGGLGLRAQCRGPGHARRQAHDVASTHGSLHPLAGRDYTASRSRSLGQALIAR